MYFLWQLANDSLGFICATCVYAALTTIGLFSRATSPTSLVTDFVVSPLDLTYLLFMRTMHLWCHHGKLSVLSARRRFFERLQLLPMSVWIPDTHLSPSPEFFTLSVRAPVCLRACMSVLWSVYFSIFPLSLLSASNLFSILHVVLSLSLTYGHTHAPTHTTNIRANVQIEMHAQTSSSFHFSPVFNHHIHFSSSVFISLPN